MLRVAGLVTLVFGLGACAHAQSQATRKAVHLGYASSGIVSPRIEVLLRNDGLLCLYDSSKVHAARVAPALVAAFFVALAEAEVAAKRSTWNRVGDVPGGGGCDTATHGRVMTIANGDEPPRSLRVVFEYGSWPEAGHYVEGDAAIEGQIVKWWRAVLEAADDATPVARSLCEATRVDGTTANGKRRTTLRVFWPRSARLR